MTGPEESFSNTRPISVAELLAKNGTIGAPPVGGRRRRRRGNNESVTASSSYSYAIRNLRRLQSPLP